MDETKETITESEAKEAEAGAITREEAEAQGVDTAKAEAEATPVEVVADTLEVKAEESTGIDERAMK